MSALVAHLTTARVFYGREEVHLLETGNRIWRGVVARVRSSKHIGVRRATDATHSHRSYPVAHASTDLPLPGNRARGMCAVFVARRPLRQNGCRRCSSRPSGFSVSVPHGRDDYHRAHPDTRGDASRGRYAAQDSACHCMRVARDQHQEELK